MEKVYEVRFFSELLNKEVIKEFDNLKAAVDFAQVVKGILIG